MTQAIQRVAVLDAASRSLGVAASLAVRGCEVRLFDRQPDHLTAIAQAGGVQVEGSLANGFVPFAAVTSDVAAALDGCQLMVCTATADEQVPLARLIAPHVRPGMILLLTTGSAGSLEIAPILRAAGLDLDHDLLLGETSNHPQSARLTGPASIRTRPPHHSRVAAFPGKHTPRLAAALDGLMSCQPAPNVLDTGLNNVNFIIHPGPMLLNYAAVERADGQLSLMNEGMTPGVLRLMDALDQEKMAILAALGLKPASLDELYVEFGSSPSVYREKGEPFGVKDRIHRRYITEDTPYGTVMFSSFGRHLGVPTPLADAINHLLATLEGTDFTMHGRTVERLGLAGLSPEAMASYLYQGH